MKNLFCMLPCPIFYFKTSVAIIDDSEAFADEVSDVVTELDLNSLVYKTPEDFKEDYVSYDYDWLQHALSFSEEDEYEVHSLKINLNNFKDLFFNPPQKSPLSLLYVDFQMPTQNGLEVLSTLEKASFQKVLLTGVADENVAVEAFNKNLIQAYLKKHSIDLREKLFSTTKNLVNDYFVKISNQFLISSCLTKYAHDVMHTSVFSKWLLTLLEEKKITKMCLIGRSGMYLMQDTEGQYYILQLVSEDDFEVLLSLSTSENTNEKILENIKNKEKYLIFFKEGKYNLPGDQSWRNHLYDVIEIEGLKGVRACFANVTPHINDIFH